MKSKNEKGRGGNIDSRPNPFGLIRGGKSGRPDLREFTDLLSVLEKGVTAGCGFIITATRDGGAIGITVLDGDTRHRTYAGNEQELQAALDGLSEYFDTP